MKIPTKKKCNAINKSVTISHQNCAENEKKLECGPMPNVMADLLNIGGARCSTPQSLADAHYWSAVQ